ncbi:hypothetical protein CRG98_043709 [Punica granatum]|uniref:Transposase MuDR plant domain-containing protein n=1 Tax=Punica granatum TaxID=22663 RepID=A0A2I0HW11_PUNGR|nr:hypothetical protein CRG98_043709 [Punica granatum]
MTELGIKYEMIAVYVEADKKDYDDGANDAIDGVIPDSAVAVDSGVAMDGGVVGEGGIVVDNEDEDEDEDDTVYYPPEEEESDAYSSADDEYNSDNNNEEFLEGHILRITQGNKQSEMQVDEERAISHQGEESDKQVVYNDNEVTPHNSADEGPKEFIRAMKDYAIYHGFSLCFLRSGEKKVEVVCKANCPWRIYAAWT